MKKTLSLLLTLMLIISLISIPPAYADSESTSSSNPYKTVFVHGMLGWGSYNSLSDVIPYFGGTSGSLDSYLRTQGFDEMYYASVGPYSSAWDRACELYAQLTGTKTDYGVAHSQKYGHERYGKDYTGQALIENFNWSSENKLNFIGHSFGGMTIRMLEDMLADGRSDEVNASKAANTTVSPLFTGGKGDYVYSITCISSPENGVSDMQADGITYKLIHTFYYSFACCLDSLGLDNVYDLQLEQFGIEKKDGESIADATARIIQSDFFDHNDNAFSDLYIERSCDLNRDLQIQPNVYYMSYYGDASYKLPTGNYISKTTSSPVMAAYVPVIGSYTGYTNDYYYDGYGSYLTKVSVPKQYIGDEWKANDGIVNIISAKVPFTVDSNGNKLYQANETYTEGTSMQSGKWYVMEPYSYDHLQAVGILKFPGDSSIRSTYKDIMTKVMNLGTSGSSAISGSTVSKFTDVSSSAWYAQYVEYVTSHGIMSGTSATTFSPNDTLTRAMVVTMLYAIDGKPSVSSGSTFTDINSSAYYSAPVSWAQSAGVVSGYSDSTFRPNTAITREQLAVILRAYATYKGKDDSATGDIYRFSDYSDITSYAVDAIKWAVGHNIISGNTDGTISPNGTATRAEAATMFTSFSKNIL